MNKDEVNAIYENICVNAQRYWVRTWLVHKLYHDGDLCKLTDNSSNLITNGFAHTRESILDSSIISLYRGFLDQGDDSLSILRLLPHSSQYLLQNKQARISEGESVCEFLYKQRYDGIATDGVFIEQWCHLVELMHQFRSSDQLQNVHNLRDYIIAHSLDRDLEKLPSYKDLHAIRDTLVPIMNLLSAIVEHKITAWNQYVIDAERIAITMGNVLTRGLENS